MPEAQIQNRHPLYSLFYLILFALAGTFVFSLLGMLIGALIYGTAELFNMTAGTASIGFVKILQIFSSIGTFIVPAWFFARFQGETPAVYFKLNTKFQPLLLILTVILMFASSALLEWTQVLNQNMHLPAFLESLETWMRQQEDQLADLTKQLLKMDSAGQLALNLFMIALLPAIGEELVFRGCFQHIFTRWTKNPHWGIWISAIIFSAIHLQFYGFLPRMLLGACFGYLLLWSNSLWFPIIAHLINNGAAVIAAFVYQQQGKPIDSLSTATVESPSVYVLSLFFTSATLWMFYRYSQSRALPNTHKHG